MKGDSMVIEKNVMDVIYEDIDRINKINSMGVPEITGHINRQMIEEHIDQSDLGFDVEIYLNQPSDVLLEPKQWNNHCLLGSYTKMSSPGILALYQKNIRSFFWGVVRYVLFHNQGFWITKNDLKYMAEGIVLTVMWHEQFHFCCDVIRQTVGSTPDFMTEEALAVAYSRKKLFNVRSDGKSRISRVQAPFFSKITQKAFSYSSPGYRDWV
ncbi:MAG: hypothetical protein ACQESN_11300, partial [Thermotogota bacterium]